VDIDGGAEEEPPPPGRDPMVGPVGLGLAVVCDGVLGGVVGLGAERLLLDAGFSELFDAEAGRESLIDPASRSEPGAEDPAAGGSATSVTDEDWESGAPLGTRLVPVPVEPSAPAFLVWLSFDCPGDCVPLLLHAAHTPHTAQTRAAATAVAAALASAWVPRFGMDATVAKTGRHAGGTHSAYTRGAARPLHRIRPGRLFA